VSVSQLEADGIAVVSVDRDARVPGGVETVSTNGWLRPRMMAHRPVLLVAPDGERAWRALHRKRSKG
jgi:hypothetical protein